MKERRTQIASELQSIDKGRGSSLTQPIISPGKGKGHEPPTPIPHNPDKNQGLDEDRVYQSSHSSCKQGSSTEVDNKKIDNNKDSNKKGSSSKSDASKSENQQQVDSNKKGSSSKSDVSQNQQQLDRVKSEGGQPSTKNLDKGRRQDGQHSSTSRTQSR